MREFLRTSLGVGFLLPLFGVLAEAPAPFDKEARHYVFPDFRRARYQIELEVDEAGGRDDSVTSVIEFFMPEEGFPILDLPQGTPLMFLKTSTEEMNVAPGKVVPPPMPNGKLVKAFDFIDQLLPKGMHSIIAISDFDKRAIWSDENPPEGVSLLFDMWDIGEATFLGNWLPSSFEWDPYTISMEVNVKGNLTDHEVFTNGAVFPVGRNSWAIQFPEYFTCSSVFFHLTERRKIFESSSAFETPKGRVIPITIYGRKEHVTAATVERFRVRTERFLSTAEANLGPWPHSSVLILDTGGGGGMEFAGATRTAEWALEHELAHSYFGRGVFAANGSSGWIDEAMAPWYSNTPTTPREVSTLPVGNLGNYGPYVTATMGGGYRLGAYLMAYWNHTFLDQGGLMPCLSRWSIHQAFHPASNLDLKREFEACFRSDLSKDFDSAVWGTAPSLELHQLRIEPRRDEPYLIHRPMTAVEMKGSL